MKYPANAAARFSVETNAAVSVACADGAMDKLYEPKPNKKLFRVATVIGYIFTVSMVAILLSLYYLVRNKPLSLPIPCDTDEEHQSFLSLFLLL